MQTGLPAISDSCIHLMASDATHVDLEMRLPPFRIVTGQDNSGKAFQEIKVDAWPSISTKGFPSLPMTGVLVQVPDKAAVTLEVVEVEYDTTQVDRLPSVDSAAPGGSPSGVDVIMDREAWSGHNGLMPGPSAQILSKAVIRGQPIVRLGFYPFQWNPSTGELRCSRKIRAVLRFTSELPHADVSRGPIHAVKRSYHHAFHRVIRQSVIKPDAPAPSVKMPHEKTEDFDFHPSYPIARPKGVVRLETRQEGLYRVGFSDLASLGINLGRIRPERLQLFHRGREVALRLAHDDLGPSKISYLEFYAPALSTPYTDTDVYWLTWGDGVGKRVEVTEVGCGSSPSYGKPIDSFRYVVHEEQNKTFWIKTPGAPNEDYWFLEKITAPAWIDYTVNIPAPSDEKIPALLKVNFRGYSTPAPHPNHHTRIRLNGAAPADQFWNDTAELTQEMLIPGESLLEGPNTLTLEIPGDTGAPFDIVFLNWIELDYTRRMEALSDTLRFTAESNGVQQFKVSGFSNSLIQVYDVSDPYSIRRLKGLDTAWTEKSFSVGFCGDFSGPATLFASSESGIQRPKMTFWKSSHLKRKTNGADYIVISTRELLPAVEGLCRLRASQGLRVKSISVEEIYDEFNHGLPDPQAIKEFLRYAYKNWARPAPTYVTLVGDGNMDYRDFKGTGKRSLVPVHLCVTGVGLIPDDNWYAAVDGDDNLPDMFIGRIPADSFSSALAGIQKVIQYESSPTPAPKRSLLVADNDLQNFTALCEGLACLLPQGLEPQRVYLKDYPQPTDAREDIVRGINEGSFVTTYAGHGNATVWADERIFQTSDVALLDNPGNLTFLMALDCFNGFFGHPDYYSLGEAFVAAPATGAIAVFASSGLGYTWEHEILSRNLFQSLFQEKQFVLGPLTTQSKIEAFAQGCSEEILQTFNLLGDPALRLKSWE